MAAVTAAIRFLPFVLFSKAKTPAWITKLGSSLPFAVMGMLVVYCLKGVSFENISGFLPELISVIVVAVSYIWKKNTLVSIILGTLLYMVLVQFVFV